MSINVLFVIGGDGTLRGAMQITQRDRQSREQDRRRRHSEDDRQRHHVHRSELRLSNRVSEAAKSIRAAHVEAKASPNGVGLVKLMGRHSGFIACYAALALNDANFVLIPEVPFRLDGQAACCSFSARCGWMKSGHAVIVVAEGAGQDIWSTSIERQRRLGQRPAASHRHFLEARASRDHFAQIGMELNLKYIDPSYAIRSVPANPHDSVYCLRLGHNAVHAAMSGRTEMVVGRWHGRFVNVPMPLAIRERYTVDPDGDLWMSVLESTGQPRVFE